MCFDNHTSPGDEINKSTHKLGGGIGHLVTCLCKHSGGGAGTAPTALQGGRQSAPRSGCFTLGKDPVPIVQVAGWPRGRYWWWHIGWKSHTGHFPHLATFSTDPLMFTLTSRHAATPFCGASLCTVTCFRCLSNQEFQTGSRTRPISYSMRNGCSFHKG